ncbi:hypothetical protein M0R45_026286 [Rubus argutus]|uniref:T-complex protein 11 n=1 Tax=Rubus argutus TaxID=59490 RepID=A0AAW1WWL4_RUBAR
MVAGVTPNTVEQIQTKLRLADLRRQEHYEKLSNKARTKPRSPSRSSSQEEDLGERLDAKLQAAEKKRLHILEKAQMRLAKLDELRQAAKSGVEMRFEKERQKLGSKVESRFKQAEANRMLMLKAYRQRRANLKERSSQSLLRKMAWENKYKERVRAAINQKRAAAEEKRLGLLEEEKKRACARLLQVQRAAESVSYQREIERRVKRDQLEDRLQRAKRQRAEYLKKRGKIQNSCQVSWKMHKQADLLSRKLARCWRRFHKLRRTTFALAKAYDTLKLKEKSVKSMPFDQLAILIESTDTLQTVKALLDRLESRLKVCKTVASIDFPSSIDNIDHLLKRVISPKRRTTPRTSLRSREARKACSVRDTTKISAKLTRYQVRVVLCAYMILGHPDAVFSGQGELEISLAKSAEEFVREFELLVKTILKGPINNSEEESDSTLPKRLTFRSQLGAFDKAWCSYLGCFVAWKVKDAQLLEGDLVRAACQMELSMLQTCKMTSEGDTADLTHDMKAIQKQVAQDQKLLREKVQYLSGESGIERMKSALSETRSKYFEAKENGSPSGLQATQFVSPSPPSSSAGPSVASLDKRSNPSHVVRSLFQEDESIHRKGFESSTSKTNLGGGQLGSSSQKLVTENELIVNEFLHEQNQTFAKIFNAAEEDQNNVQSKIRFIMEKAFWDGIMESVNQEEPNYDLVIQLLEEVRDEICTMAPQGWKQEIVEAIDVDILSQVLKSGNLDIDYLGKILEFSMVTLQRLSAPANDDEMTETLQSLRKELDEICNSRDQSNCSGVVAMIKGLRFVLEQIQVLKREISKARIRIMEPLLKGPNGLQYLRNAFANRYGPASDTNTSLPLTAQWLSSVWNCKDQEWQEHRISSSTLMSSDSSSHDFLPSTTLRSGGSFLLKPNSSTSSRNSQGNQQPECKGEGVDLLVRLGLLKLVSGVSGLTEAALPETLMLNLSRLRAVQAQIQKIIVSSISILICRQTILSERVTTSPTDMEGILSRCIERLLGILDSVEDAGMEEIVESISDFSVSGSEVVDLGKVQSRKMVIARIGSWGSGPLGRKLAETALRQVGAVVLIDSVVEAAEVLVVAATISVGVHGPWYVHLTDNM